MNGSFYGFTQLVTIPDSPYKGAPSKYTPSFKLYHIKTLPIMDIPFKNIPVIKIQFIFHILLPFVESTVKMYIYMVE